MRFTRARYTRERMALVHGYATLRCLVSEERLHDEGVPLARLSVSRPCCGMAELMTMKARFQDCMKTCCKRR